MTQVSVSRRRDKSGFWQLYRTTARGMSEVVELVVREHEGNRRVYPPRVDPGIWFGGGTKYGEREPMRGSGAVGSRDKAPGRGALPP